MAQLVSDPWFCAAATRQVGLCAHFIHQFSAGLAALESVLARILCGAANLTPRAGGAQGGLRELSVRDGLDPPPQAYFYLSLGLDRSRQPLWLQCIPLFWVY